MAELVPLQCNIKGGNLRGREWYILRHKVVQKMARLVHSRGCNHSHWKLIICYYKLLLL